MRAAGRHARWRFEEPLRGPGGRTAELRGARYQSTIVNLQNAEIAL